MEESGQVGVLERSTRKQEVTTWLRLIQTTLEFTRKRLEEASEVVRPEEAGSIWSMRAVVAA